MHSNLNPLEFLSVKVQAAIPLAVAGIGFMGVRAWEIFCHADSLFAITEQTQKLLGIGEATS
ncbi:hypothetical protein H6G06_12715 [Anabaena sphaerica FACHB-251]|uniref:Uncharacterized protein n=1 Tax=Anabaena sphaerica FACHB-251 TaxID=2692883 RepID=A0A926WGV3_9NOST|nr:hypothetical protein [Anabaena sphaerica]MBD2294324.1 hypothetical protein [Anabaena sphaerica FACHB-251]